MMQKQWFVYVLRCRDGSYYTGATNDLGKRLRLHGSGKGSRYVRSRLPFRMVLCERMETARDAYRRERGIKALSRKEKEALVLGTTLQTGPVIPFPGKRSSSRPSGRRRSCRR